jgi:hypothetical protein
MESYQLSKRKLASLRERERERERRERERVQRKRFKKKRKKSERNGCHYYLKTKFHSDILLEIVFRLICNELTVSVVFIPTTYLHSL